MAHPAATQLFSAYERVIKQFSTFIIYSLSYGFTILLIKNEKFHLLHEERRPTSING